MNEESRELHSYHSLRTDIGEDDDDDDNDVYTYNDIRNKENRFLIRFIKICNIVR
jgi:hypothetical protein